MKQQFQAISKLWRSIDSWEQQTVDWTEGQFKAIEVEVIMKDIAVYTKTAHQGTKQLTSSQVAPMFMEKVSAPTRGMKSEYFLMIFSLKYSYVFPLSNEGSHNGI